VEARAVAAGSVSAVRYARAERKKQPNRNGVRRILGWRL